ncbi:MAG: nuclear transport factor 2 family protein [Balneolales bacterium]|nr:nuclear transport factor 2 family protein [Balneolales bacterium]
MESITINFDSLKKETWNEQENKNVALLIDFVQNLMNNHRFEYVLTTFGNQRYLQHNRGIPDGLEALVRYVQEFVKRFPEYTYDVKHIYADGDFVTFHSHVTTNSRHRGNDRKGLNIIDTWKVEDGLIVEHWDAIQPLDAFMRFYVWLNGGKILNANGVY